MRPCSVATVHSRTAPGRAAVRRHTRRRGGPAQAGIRNPKCSSEGCRMLVRGARLPGWLHHFSRPEAILARPGLLPGCGHGSRRRTGWQGDGCSTSSCPAASRYASAAAGWRTWHRPSPACLSTHVRQFPSTSAGGAENLDFRGLVPGHTAIALRGTAPDRASDV